MFIPKYYEDPHSLHVNTMPNRAYFVPFQSEDAAVRDCRKESSRLTMLSGEWRFGYYDSIRRLPQDLFAPDAAPDKIPVPSVWQCHGYDRHQYTNVRYPFPYDPPHVPVDIPCGLYTRDFDYAAAEGRRQYVNFEGVDSCYYLYLNGRFVGYSQVPHSTSEFDITDYLAQGKNTITVLVLKWCDGSYFEDQDKLRQSGIFRDVYILDRAACHIRDYFVKTRPAADYSSAKIAVQLDLLGGQKRVDYRLLNEAGEKIAAGRTSTGRISITVDHPVLWNAEHPYLYKLILRCEDEFIMEPVGIRDIRIVNGVLLINGQNIKFHGVNRHDSDPFVGSAVTEENMLRDLTIMRNHNITAIRTSHYPNSPLFTRMCDKFGFYVVGEADMECHGVTFTGDDGDMPAHDKLANDPEYAETFLDRVQRSVCRDKNRPSVVMWSMGNESGQGANLCAAMEWTKAYDDTRVTHYERPCKYADTENTPLDKRTIKCMDVFSRMYPTLKEMDQYCEEGKIKKPYVLCEFTHAMGNGPGDCEDYWQMFQKHDSLCGGFVWEWCDHAMYMGDTNDNQRKFYYGGDWGEFPHDVNFCMDGLVYPDRTPHTGLLEYKNVLRPLRFRAIDLASGRFIVHNYLDFSVAGEKVGVSYTVKQAGETIFEGTLTDEQLAVAPHGEKEITVSYPASLSGEFAVYFETRKKQDSALVPAGHVLGYEQLGVNALPLPAPVLSGRGAMPMVAGDGIVVTGDSFRYEYDTARALFTSMVKDNITVLKQPMDFILWRAPTDNDRNIRNEWQAAGYDRVIPRGYATRTETENGSVVISTDFSLGAIYLPNIITGTVTWTVSGAGSVTCDVKARLREGKPVNGGSRQARFGADNTVPPLPGFGIRMFLDKSLATLDYFGYGPYESYIDKRQASYKDLFHSTVQGEYEPYIKPQENGSHYDCDMVRLSGAAGGVLVTGEGFSFNASEYTAEELTRAPHNYDLEKSGMTVLTIQVRQAGIGSNSCGPRLLPQYQLRDDLDFAFTLTPFAGE